MEESVSCHGGSVPCHGGKGSCHGGGVSCHGGSVSCCRGKGLFFLFIALRWMQNPIGGCCSLLKIPELARGIFRRLQRPWLVRDILHPAQGVFPGFCLLQQTQRKGFFRFLSFLLAQRNGVIPVCQSYLTQGKSKPPVFLPAVISTGRPLKINDISGHGQTSRPKLPAVCAEILTFAINNI